MARERRTRSGRSGGGAGAVITAVVIIALLGGLAWFGWTQIQKAKKRPEVPSGPRVTVLGWTSRYSLKGEVPEPLPDPWRFSFEATHRHRRVGEETEYPGAWVELQYEGGKFSGVQVAVYVDAVRAGPFDLIQEPEFSSEAEGRELRGFVRELGEKADKSSVERETANFRFFGWRNKDDSRRRRSLVCVVRKGGAPRAAEMYSKARADWAAAGAATSGPKAGRTKFDVMLVSVGKDKDGVLAALCEVLKLNPEVGKILVDSAPKPVKQSATWDQAQEIKRKLEAAGAKVEIK